MDDKIRCQSCGMPLGGGLTDPDAVTLLGTREDGSKTEEYCKFCYQNGSFTDPRLTVNGMVDRSTQFMVKEHNIPEQKAREMSLAIIPYLRRWNL